MTDPREALAVGTPPGTDGEHYFFKVGHPYRKLNPATGLYVEVGIIDRITVTTDLPGMYCSLERVRVYVGETCVWEAPLHNCEAVEYELPEAVERE